MKKCKFCEGDYFSKEHPNKSIMLEGYSANSFSDKAELIHFSETAFFINSKEHNKQAVVEFNFCPECGRNIVNR